MNDLERIDGAFRRKLARRDFPRDAEHMEQMRALLQAGEKARTSARYARAWWLVPAFTVLGAALWWATSPADEGASVHGSSEWNGVVPAQVGSVETVTAPRQCRNGHPVTPPAFIATSEDVSRQQLSMEQSAQAHDVFAFAERANDAQRPRINASTTKPQQYTDLLSGTTAFVVSMAHPPHTLELPLPSWALATTGEPAELEDLQHWLQRPMCEAGPLECMPSPTWQAHGARAWPNADLHVFGAMLSVSAQWPDGVRSASPGSTFALEYRMRKKRWSVVTGVHLTTFNIQRAAQQAGAAEANVRINYLDLPLLVGYEQPLGRWGLGLQTGLAARFLFNAAGSYPGEADGLAGVLPDGLLSTVGAEWLVRPHVRFGVLPNLSVCAGPQWQASLTSLSEQGLFANGRAHQVGLQAGFIWRLGRNTY